MLESSILLKKETYCSLHRIFTPHFPLVHKSSIGIPRGFFDDDIRWLHGGLVHYPFLCSNRLTIIFAQLAHESGGILHGGLSKPITTALNTGNHLVWMLANEKNLMYAYQTLSIMLT